MIDKDQALIGILIAVGIIVVGMLGGLFISYLLKRGDNRRIRITVEEPSRPTPTPEDLRGATQALARLKLVPLHRLPEQEYVFVAVRDPDERDVRQLVHETGLRITDPMKVLWLAVGGDIVKVLCPSLAATLAFRLQAGLRYRFAIEAGEYKFYPVA